MARHRPCPEGCGWAASFDPYFKRWRCYSCGWMPRSAVEVWRKVAENPRCGGAFPSGAVAAAAELAPGAEYIFMVETARGQWDRLESRTFVGFVREHSRSPESALEDDIHPTGARLEFTHNDSGAVMPGVPHGSAAVHFWDGGARDGYIPAEQLLGADADIALVPAAVFATDGAKRRTDDNLRGVFG